MVFPLYALLLTTHETHAPNLYHYWPRFSRPQTMLVVPFVNDHEAGMVLETAAGLVARACLEGEAEQMLLEDVSGNSSYAKWTAMMMAQVRPRLEGPIDMWEAVRKLREAGFIKGYILYRYDTHDRPLHALGEIDESANVATALARVLKGIAVSESLEPRAEALGLPLLLDVRQRTEAWCLQNYGPHFTRRAVMTADPKSRMARSFAVAMGTFVVSKPGATYEAALAHCVPDSPVLGWGCGGEDQQTLPSSEWGLFQTATNWCHNLPAYSTEQAGQTIPREQLALPVHCRHSLADLRWESGVHYVSFLMSDGDNVQWLMGNFAGGPEGRYYYESPVRGEFPFGWTCCYLDLAQLCPYVLVDLFARATPNDDFVLYGGGYFYPDRFGTKRHRGLIPADRRLSPPKESLLRLHARRMGEFMRLGHLRPVALNALQWDSSEAQTAYNIFAEEIPELDGIFTVQYYPYSGGEGRILWAGRPKRKIPVIACRLTIWAKTNRPRDTTPAGVAKWLNNMPCGGPQWTEEHFSFVMSHSWSRFRDTHGDPSLTLEEQNVDQHRDSPNTARGLLPVKWCVDRLASNIRVVTPSELALLIRLHLRTREMLSEYAASLRPRVKASRSSRARKLLVNAEQKLLSVHDGDESGRHCFQLLQQTERLVRSEGGD
ncbi:MAG: hypothetical protein ACUVX8_12620 [Candidatus Zipacnadales bacterium]